MKAREDLAAKDWVVLPYQCKISGGKETLVLISEQAASSLEKACDTLKDAVDAVLVTSVWRTELCVCDLATISGLEEEAVHQRLERLVAVEVLTFRVIDGMNYFQLAKDGGGEEVRQRIRGQLNQK